MGFIHKYRNVFGKRQICNNWGFVLYLFLVLFAPPLIPMINLIIPISIYSFIAILVKYRSQLVQMATKSGIKKLFVGIALYYVYYGAVLLVCLLTGNMVQAGHYVRTAYSFFLMSPIMLICVLYIILRSRELRYSNLDLIRSFVWAGMIQALIAIISLLFPSVKAFLVSIMYANTGDVLLSITWMTNVRYFGFANSMLDLFGFGMGILATISLFLASEKGYRYLVCFPIMLSTSFLNARSGVVIAGIGLFVFIIYLLISKRYVFMIVIIVSCLLSSVLGIKLIEIYAPNTVKWSIRDIGSFIGQDKTETGTANVLLDKSLWRLPDNVPNIIFGSGHSLYRADGFKHSDVGYINDLWRTGILGMIILYVPFIVTILGCARKGYNKLVKALSVTFIISILVFLVKGSIWVYSPGILTILSLVAYNTYLAVPIKNDWSTGELDK